MKQITAEQEIRRCEIMGWSYPEEYKSGGTRSFEGLDFSTAEALLLEGYLDENDSQNCSPTAKQFFEIMSKYPSITAHGYAVSPERNDCRVTIEGIEYNGIITWNMRADLIELCRYADTFDMTEDSFYCWYD